MNDLSFLEPLPQFQSMRNRVRQHPEILPQLLQEIGQSNPQLLQVRIVFIVQNFFYLVLRLLRLKRDFYNTTLNIKTSLQFARSGRSNTANRH